eukprot:224039-Prymnesium_polylepis.1
MSARPIASRPPPPSPCQHHPPPPPVALRLHHTAQRTRLEAVQHHLQLPSQHPQPHRKYTHDLLSHKLRARHKRTPQSAQRCGASSTGSGRSPPPTARHVLYAAARRPPQTEAAFRPRPL